MACAAAVALLVVRGGRRERRAAAAFGTVGGVAFVVPLALALLGLDYVEPRNLIGSLVPILIVVAIGLDAAIEIGARGRALRAARLAPAAALVAASMTMIVATAIIPRLERDDWRGISDLLLANRPIGLIVTQPPSAAKPLRYYFGHPLKPLAAGEFPCGVRSRTILTVSRNQPLPAPRAGFRLVAVTETSQDWRVAAYRAPRPRRLDAEELRILDILAGDESSRVDAADPVEPRPLPGDPTSGNRRPPPAGACGGGPGIAVRLDSS